MSKDWIKKFIEQESLSSLILLAAVVLALLWANSPLQQTYYHIWSNTHVVHFINDGLMAIFFFLMSYEVKYEILAGRLNSIKKSLLPIIAAMGGMLLPAGIFLAINHGPHGQLAGWAIPTATDIAFSLAVLMLLRNYISLSLKIFLTLLAIIDDIGAILIIAIVYTKQLNVVYLCLSLLCWLALMIMNRMNIKRFLPFAITGIILWYFVFYSGLHATIAGVLLGFALPLRLSAIRDSLHKWVAFIILPLFAFANAGISLSGMTPHDMLHPLALGILLGLFIGKQWGVFIFSWLAVKCKIAALPSDMSWKHLYGVSILCGIGFTMSLFIGDLAFADSNDPHVTMLIRLAVMGGSLLSALLGYLFLRCGHTNQANQNKT